jgi:hypothetical protein
MSLARTLRLRLVMVLAICAVLWSDPAVAELVCAATPSCPHHATQIQASRLALPTITGTKACCPRHSAPVQTPTCCAATEGAAVLPAASFSSRKNGPKHSQALIASTLFSSPSLAERSRRFSSDISISYDKPVDQKKTDLRI